jgi:hypothetical protein
MCDYASIGYRRGACPYSLTHISGKHQGMGKGLAGVLESLKPFRAIGLFAVFLKDVPALHIHVQEVGLNETDPLPRSLTLAEASKKPPTLERICNRRNVFLITIAYNVEEADHSYLQVQHVAVTEKPKQYICVMGHEWHGKMA